MTRLNFDTDSINTWLRQNATPLRHLEAGSGFDDLQPLKDVWRDAQVIGLGESTHGTREFFQAKHRLLEFLVRELGFTVFALEASHTACEPVNDYIHGGGSNVETLLSGIHYLAWHTLEFVAMVEWMREWNASSPADRKVTFLGVDVTFNERGREAVVAFLQRAAPEWVAEAARIFDTIERVEPRWPFGIDTAGEEAVREVLPALDNLLAWLHEHRDLLASRSSIEEVNRARFYVKLMPQWWRGGSDARSGYMGANLIHLLDRDGPGAKAIFWAHNGHVGAADTAEGTLTAGYLLRERFGDGYVACALEFGEGAYQYRIIEPGPAGGKLATDTVGPPQMGSLPWRLSQTGIGAMLVNLRNAPADTAIGTWLITPLPAHALNWASETPQSTLGGYEDVTPGASFDSIVFVERTTAVRPTESAISHAARGELF